MRLKVELGMDDDFDITIPSNRSIVRSEMPGAIRFQSVRRETLKDSDWYLEQYGTGFTLHDLSYIMDIDKDTILLVDSNDKEIGKYLMKNVPDEIWFHIILGIKYDKESGMFIFKISDTTYDHASQIEINQVTDSLNGLLWIAQKHGFLEEMKKTFNKYVGEDK